jgi:hypothetical protein
MFASMEKRNLKAIFPRHIRSMPPHSYALISTMLAILAGSSIISFLRVAFGIHDHNLLLNHNFVKCQVCPIGVAALFE